MTSTPVHVLACDVAIIGGSLGGCAADHPANTGLRVIMTEAAAWIGGQISAQGVSALDEHPHIERFGATQRYLNLRTAIRHGYQQAYGVPLVLADSVLGPGLPLNPGNGWVSRLCFLPERGLQALEAEPRHAQRLLHCRPVAAEVDGRQVVSVTVEHDDGTRTRIHARYFLDATDTGELLPLTGTAWVTGAEARTETGEPHAADEAQSSETQGFTYCFAVEYCPGEDHTIPPPPGYATFRDAQPYTLAPAGRDGEPVIFEMFTTSAQGNLPFWSYRRIHDGALLGGHDLSLVNWVSNDYHGKTILDVAAEDAVLALDEARHLSLGFLHWLQTECPRDEGGTGYPEFRLRPDVMGTVDGLSQTPYIRESRRLVALRRVVEQDIAAEHHPGARARHFSDSVGIGWYAIDLHPCVGNPSSSMYAPTRPFQIPLGALIPCVTTNLIAACKNIGTTHLTNGAYRLHPVEWAVGEAAGLLAAFCLTHNCTPQQVAADPWLTWRLQAQLVRAGCPIYWALDVPTGHPLFAPTQLLLARDLIVPDSERWHSLEIGLNQSIGATIDRDRLAELADELNTHAGMRRVDERQLRPDMTWAALCEHFAPGLATLL